MTDATHHARPTRKLVGVVLAAVAALVIPLISTTSALGAPPPTATRIEIAALGTAGVNVPATQGTPDYYVVAGRAFALTLEFYGDGDDDGVADELLPLSYNKDIRVQVLVTQDGENTTFQGTAPSNKSGATVGGTLTEPDLDSSLSVEALVRPSGSVTGDSIESFEVLIASTEAPEGSSFLGIGGGGGLGSPCDANPTDQVCADLLLPEGAAITGALLSLGLCDTESCLDELVQVLVGLQPTVTNPDGGGDYENPATLIMKCDKTLCPGGGIQTYNLSVNLAPDDPAVPAEECPAKGVVGADQEFCVDYVQSTRSNAGDTYLYLLFVVDAKVRFL